MLIREMSDLHLEFINPQQWAMPRMEGEKDMVLVLAGDITAEHNKWSKGIAPDTYTPWLRDICERHRAVIYVPGNHEYYSGNLPTVDRFWKAMAGNIDNLHWLNRNTVVIDDVRFVGATLWTNIDNPLHELTIGGMNDFSHIWVDGDLFTTQDWRLEHEADRYFIETELSKEHNGNTVVVTHHAPSFYSTAGKYAGNPYNVGYASSLDRLMWYNDIALWFHGHTHVSHDYTIGDEVQSTRVICNPRGYDDEEGDINPGFDPLLTVEIK